MNLSDRSLEKRIEEFFPKDKGSNNTINLSEQLQPSTIDLRLGSMFWRMYDVAPVFAGTYEKVIDPRSSDAIDFFYQEEVPPGSPFIMNPGPAGFALGVTMEHICVPDDLVAFVDGRSSYGRWGLRIHSTAGLIDAGFQGAITLEISLDSSRPMLLYPGDRICQVRFEKLDFPARRPYGDSGRRSKYQNQASAVPSLSRKDRT